MEPTNIANMNQRLLSHFGNLDLVFKSDTVIFFDKKELELIFFRFKTDFLFITILFSFPGLVKYLFQMPFLFV